MAWSLAELRKQGMIEPSLMQAIRMPSYDELSAGSRNCSNQKFLMHVLDCARADPACGLSLNIAMELDVWSTTMDTVALAIPSRGAVPKWSHRC